MVPSSSTSTSLGVTLLVFGDLGLAFLGPWRNNCSDEGPIDIGCSLMCVCLFPVVSFLRDMGG